MSNFKRNDGRRGFNKRDSFGGQRERGPVEMYPAICSDCGKKCEVPFRPTNQKPVYCLDCFKKQGGPSRSSKFSSGERGGPRDERRENFGAPKPDDRYYEQINKLIAKLDIIINILTLGDKRLETSEIIKSPIKTDFKDKEEVAEKATEKISFKKSPKSAGNKGKKASGKTATKKK
jgi:CxxC-x17-CxxC domain-containing protein